MANKIINSLQFNSGDINVLSLPYGECSTAAATAEKTVTVENFALEKGAQILVKFTVTNTAASSTLNVNSTGAKAIMYRGGAISAGYLAANRVYQFVYDGTDWEFVGDIDTNSDNDKKTSSGNTNSKIYLVGATSQSSSGQTTYSHDTAYVGTDGHLYSNSEKVAPHRSGVYYIEGSGTTDSTNKISAWVGTSNDISAYYDGLMIAYRVGVVGQSTTTLNINELGAKTIYRYSTAKLTTQHPVGSVILLVFSAQQDAWYASDYDSNTTYTNVALGQGYATDSRTSAATAVTATLSSYALTTGGVVVVRFVQDVPANATLNINSKGAKNIYFRNAQITANIIKSGDTAAFLYDGTRYRLISVDRWHNDIVSKSAIGHSHTVSTSNAAPQGHTHSVVVSGTTGANSGSAVTVATGSLSSTGGGATVATGSSGTATVLTGVKVSGTANAVTSINGGQGTLLSYDSESSSTASPDGERIPYIESITSTGASANGTATVLTGVKASGTDTFLKEINAGSGSLTSDTTTTTGIKYIESVSHTAAGVSSTAKAGSETHTHTYAKPTGVSLGSNSTADGGVKYVEGVSHTAASLTGTKTFNTDAIKSVTLSASSTSTDGPAYIESISGGSAVSKTTKYMKFTPGTTPPSAASFSGTQGTTSQASGNTGAATPSFTGSAVTSGGASSTTTSASGTLLTGVSVSNGVLSFSTGTHTHTLSHTHSVTAAGTVSSHSHSLNSHTHTLTPSGSVTFTTGTAPSMNFNTQTSSDTPYISSVSGGSAVTATTKYMKATGTAASTGTVGISGGGISVTTKYFHPTITTDTTATTGAPSATTTFVTGISGGGISAVTKYLVHSHTGASAKTTASAVTAVAANGTTAVLTGVKGGTITAITKYLEHTHEPAAASSSTAVATAVAANGTATAVTGISTSKLVTSTASPNAHTHSYGSSTALTTGSNSGTAVAAATAVNASTT